ncbi:S-adenosyl-L-methionine-dependent methyltransferase [Morchella conica CCBAS932]|uniref:S-adenosyl-L-methionine-dependent methyltransferase n=1 Tax=Morchella conica CCBAS932 TaxID=1392247 RepID=A0A3N4LEC7_9PEZI|nr:S-adenosyl-L-methionine-dependent methyltransferase [Morchella conica CCBAS932]
MLGETRRKTELLKETEDVTVIDQVVGADDPENNGEYMTEKNPCKTSSLDPEVKQYRYENGRRYHAYSEGLYWAPNDDKQNEQLDIFHHVYTLVLDGALYLAPIGENPERVLDLGTGTGIWAIDIADKFPNTRVIGNDLSPIQPTWVPSNCSFEIDDFTKPWEHILNSFNFIHGRALHGSVFSWTCLYKEAYAALKPGGWFESVETTIGFYIDDDEGQPTAIGSTTSISQWWMEDALFVNMEENIFKVPIGSWPKDPKMKNIGRYNLLNLRSFRKEGFTLSLFTRFLDWTADEVYVLLAGVRSELRSKDNNFYFKMYVVYGQRPFE